MVNPSDPPLSSAAGDLAATPLIDGDHPLVQGFSRKHALGADDRERAVALYYAVRDGFRYDPYRIDLSLEGMRASHVLEIGLGWCVTRRHCCVPRRGPLASRRGWATLMCATTSVPSACARP